MSPEADEPRDDARILRPAGEGDIDWVMAEERRPDFAKFVSVWPYERHAGFLDDPDRRLLIAEDGSGARTGFVNAQGLTTAARAVELPRIIVSEPGRASGAG